ncbi:MAG: TetR/AcrR family transcriptional regulator [Actinomycetota bacterium]|nr:TetR/AcrR family transcriptional regulator [Actinomycetota bacterium]MDQ2959169.1 TetR/AcrR family transcriptional regulator [Actinomycetota bacterium]
MAKENAPRTARARVRDELSREIRQVARRQLAEVGSAELSLRAVARELGMVSSAVYRYYPSRDELLTALIIDAYDAVGAAAEAAEAGCRRSDLTGRWLALTRAVRGWARANPQEYALIFGSPVPGYQAPRDTVDPAARIPLLMVRIVSDAIEAGRLPAADGPIPRPVRADLKALRALIAPAVPEHQLARAVMAWTQLIGSISFELFGHLTGAVQDYEAYFDFQMGRIARELGLG